MTSALSSAVMSHDLTVPIASPSMQQRMHRSDDVVEQHDHIGCILPASDSPSENLESALSANQLHERCPNDNVTTSSETWPMNPKGSSVSTTLVVDSSNKVIPATEANSLIGSPDCDSEVDSVLLAGMRDPRERVALLRLEKSIIDFMKSDFGWLEVGGPYNSTVIAPSSVTKTGQDNSSSSHPNGFLGCSSSNSYSTDYAPGQRQTTFQKKVLHRLADRFGIVREQGSLLYGAIRLIKLPTSKTPSKLLQDLEPEEYLNNSNVYDSRQRYDSSSSYFRHNGSEQQQINTISRTFANTALVEPRECSVGVISNVNSKSRKMTIMKRSDSKPRENNGVDNSKKLTRRNSSEVSEKEKVYFETRARIFNEDASIASNVADSDRNAGTTAIGDPSNFVSGSVANTDANVIDTAPLPRMENPNEYHTESVHSSNSTLLQRQDSGGPPYQQQAMQPDTLQFETKAVYRNRAKEAADPDFRRHRTTGTAAIVPTTTASYGVGLVVSPTPVHATVPSVPYASPTSQPWVQSSPSMYPALQQQRFTQSSPYYAVPRHQQSSQPQQHFHHPQHPYAFPQQPVHPHPYDSVSSISVKQHPPSVSSGFGYHGASTASNNSSSVTGLATSTKSRAVTLKAAAPAFYPPSVIASGLSVPRIASSFRVEANCDDTTSSGPSA